MIVVLVIMACNINFRNTNIFNLKVNTSQTLFNSYYLIVLSPIINVILLLLLPMASLQFSFYLIMCHTHNVLEIVKYHVLNNFLALEHTFYLLKSAYDRYHTFKFYYKS